ncbi:hypothetical protein C8R45DRAFT_1220935 [Mycena sanguinolenta]|nr:hypothetical protein C8R45DRAFT_1220935 [Mycena sanguinolenta]
MFPITISIPTSDPFTPQDLHVNGREEARKLPCPKIGCSFEAFQLKELEVHVDAAHREHSRQFQCLEDHCGFSTTTQGALTRHYRERHHIEPPSSGRKLAPVRRRALREEQPPVASTSRISEPSPAPEVTKYYPATAYYPESSPRASPVSDTGVSPHLSSLRMRSTAAAATSLPQVASTESLRSEQCENPASYFALQRSWPTFDSTDSLPDEQWVSWRDECDIAPDSIVAIATGEQTLCEIENSLCVTCVTDEDNGKIVGELTATECLPWYGDFGLAEKRLLWA